ncbi:hypothetical protein C0991_006389 [Blastosporella zonata]|nr:hypothetical protein C0991_006389 [Blastosporella zonata]
MARQSNAALMAELSRLKLEVHSLKTEQGTEISVGNYLLTRLEQLGVTDLIEDHPHIDWVGNCNELNAAYAADGYARVKDHSIGVVLTTFGVGELSATNGIAGGKLAIVPQVIDAYSAISLLRDGPRIESSWSPQHVSAKLETDVASYSGRRPQFTYSQASLKNKNHAAAEIDRVLIDCITKARPVYMALPTDLVSAKISTERLRTPLTRSPPHNDPQIESFVLDLVVKQFEQAQGDAVILVDACTIRHDTRDELKEFLEETKFPVYSTPMGKTAVDENYDRYGGIYLGSISRPEIKDKVEAAKLVLSVGALRSDFNTGNFSYNIPVKRTIELHSDNTKVQYAAFPGIGMKQFLPKLTERLKSYHVQASKMAVPRFLSLVPKEKLENISHTFFWPRMSQFFRPKDVIVTETGTANFGILDVPLPERSVLVSQILWGSIGCLLGASLAAKESGRGRSILFVGDGSLQLTVQELSVMLRVGVKPIIFVLNNKGYTIERYIHGKTRKYNDISNWKWTSLLNVLGDPDGMLSNSYTVSTKNELSNLLDNPAFARADKMQLVEVMMDKMDAPKSLMLQAEMSGKANAYDSTSNPVVTV